MKGVEPIESGLDLQLPEQDLDSSLREPSTGARAEERGRGIEAFAPRDLPWPEPRELGFEGVGQEQVPGPATLGDLSPEPNADSRLPTRQVGVAHVQADEFREA